MSPESIPHEVGRRTVLTGAVALGVLGAGVTVAPEASAAGRPVLRYGMTGAAVRDLQQRLSRQSYWLGRVDGSFGPATQQAVYAVQKNWGIGRDGVVGPITWNRILRDVPPRSRYRGDRIEIDKKRQLAIVVWNGRVRHTLNTSTGSNEPFSWNGHWYDGRTPSGSFRVFRHVNGWVHNDLGALYRPYFFNGAIALHGDYARDVPPYNASHGCCRISTAAQDMLVGQGYLKNGRRITVY